MALPGQLPSLPVICPPPQFNDYFSNACDELKHSRCVLKSLSVRKEGTNDRGQIIRSANYQRAIDRGRLTGWGLLTGEGAFDRLPVLPALAAYF